MRKPSYLSPSALAFWNKGSENYYLQYLADNRPPRFAQTQPMSIGSSFDAYIKSYLYVAIFNNVGDYAFEELFETQVEQHNRDWALVAGKVAFDAYVTSGACADLLKELEAADGEPRFETKVQGTVHGVPMLGKPDLYYVNKLGGRVILDWKVNGYCSKASPRPGFMKCRDGWIGDQSRANGQAHKSVVPVRVDGIAINAAKPLEQVDKTWATQLATYAWLLGCPVGSEFVVAIDQLACSPGKIRVAEHRAIILADYQRATLKEYQDLWIIIQSGYILRDRSQKEARARQAILDNQFKAFTGEDASLMKEIHDRGSQMY